MKVQAKVMGLFLQWQTSDIIKIEILTFISFSSHFKVGFQVYLKFSLTKLCLRIIETAFVLQYLFTLNSFLKFLCKIQDVYCYCTLFS